MKLWYQCFKIIVPKKLEKGFRITQLLKIKDTALFLPMFLSILWSVTFSFFHSPQKNLRNLQLSSWVLGIFSVIWSYSVITFCSCPGKIRMAVISLCLCPSLPLGVTGVWTQGLVRKYGGLDVMTKWRSVAKWALVFMKME
jgi:hypothetical protein